MFIKAAPAAAVVAALPGAAYANEASPLPGMIAAYHKAAGAFEAAVDEQEAAETRFKATLSPIVALSLGPDGERTSGGLEYRKFSTEAIEDEIRKTHAQLRERHCGRYVQLMAPQVSLAMADALDTSLADCLKELQDASETEAALERAVGLTAAEELYEQTYEVEKAATMALLGYIPRNAWEAKAKAEWLSKLARECRGCLGDDEMTALIASIAGGEA